jgi:uncharacterized membrane protein required for colicin V production
VHPLDIVFLVITALLVVVGIKRGLIREAFRLLALLGGFIAAAALYRPVSARLCFLSASANVRIAVAFAALFVGTAVALLVLGWSLRKVVHLTMLGWIDRLCGGCIGLLKAMLLAWAVVPILSVLPVKRLHDGLETSFTYTALVKYPPRLYAAAVEEAEKSIREVIPPEAVETLQGARKTIEMLRTGGQTIDTFRSRVDSAHAASRARR